MAVPESIWWLPILKTAAALVTTGAAIVGVVFPEAVTLKKPANLPTRKRLGRRGKWIVSLALAGFATLTAIEWRTATEDEKKGKQTDERHADVLGALQQQLEKLDGTNKKLMVTEGTLGTVVQGLASQSRSLFRQVAIGSLTLDVEMCRKRRDQIEKDETKIVFVLLGGQWTPGATLVQLECQLGSVEGFLKTPGTHPEEQVSIPCRRVTQIVTTEDGDRSHLSAHIDVREVLDCAGNDPSEWPVSQFGDLRGVRGHLRISGTQASKACRASLTLNGDVVIEIPLADNDAGKTGTIEDLFMAAWASSVRISGGNE